MRLFLLSFVSLAAATFSPSEVSMLNDNESLRQRFRESFEEWMETFEMEFSTGDYLKRLDNWIMNELYIMKHNAEEGKTYTLAHNKFSHLSSEEFKAIYLSYKRPTDGLLRSGKRTTSVANLDSITEVPDTVDWVEAGAVTEVKNQGTCGSCWSFSTTGAVEGAHFINTGELVSLSEQQILDCTSSPNAGCNGGDMGTAMDQMERKGGFCREDDYPYKPSRFNIFSQCKECEIVATIDGHQSVPTDDEEAMLKAVSQQPISVAIEADQQDFQLYSGGVLTAPCGTNLDHGVLLVGYGTDADGGGTYWKIKNSWGPEWGEDGYIKLSRAPRGGTPPNDGDGECGILMEGVYPVVTSHKKEEGAASEETKAETELELAMEAEEKDLVAAE